MKYVFKNSELLLKSLISKHNIWLIVAWTGAQPGFF